MGLLKVNNKLMRVGSKLCKIVPDMSPNLDQITINGSSMTFFFSGPYANISIANDNGIQINTNNPTPINISFFIVPLPPPDNFFISFTLSRSVGVGETIEIIIDNTNTIISDLSGENVKAQTRTDIQIS